MLYLDNVYSELEKTSAEQYKMNKFPFPVDCF